MITVLLITIYIAFISLGLPDSMLGSAWPSMRFSFGATTEMAGIISFVVASGTVVSSLLSTRLINKLGTGKVTMLSVLATALALLGFAFSPSFIFLVLLAIPLGLGAGAVDAALNNYVALNFKAKHLNWLHAFWGIGAMTGPVIMSAFLSGGDNNWSGAYLTVGIIQAALVVILLISLPLWKKFEKNHTTDESEEKKLITNKQALGIKGAKYALIAFFCYCAMESSTGLWASSYLTETHLVSPDKAAGFVSMFFAGITIGRLLSGVLTAKINSKNLIRLGSVVSTAGILLMLLPLPWYMAVAGLLIFGLGCAPIYPSIIHETPVRFGEKASQSVIGLEMASAYVGSTLMPPITGFITGKLGMNLLPVVLIILALVMIFTTEKVNKITINKYKGF